MGVGITGIRVKPATKDNNDPNPQTGKPKPIEVVIVSVVSKPVALTKRAKTLNKAIPARTVAMGEYRLLGVPFQNNPTSNRINPIIPENIKSDSYPLILRLRKTAETVATGRNKDKIINIAPTSMRVLVFIFKSFL